MNLHTEDDDVDHPARRQSSGVDRWTKSTNGHVLRDNNLTDVYITSEANPLSEYVDSMDEGFSSGRASSMSVFSLESSPLPSPHASSVMLPAVRRHSSAVSDEGFETQTLPRRPGSSRYHVLPSIGQTLSHADVIADEVFEHSAPDRDKAQQYNRESLEAGVTPRTKSRSRLQNHAKRSEQHSFPVKSSELPINKGQGRLVDEPVVLAVKLPSGQRVEHQFLSTHRLVDVLDHVRAVARQEFVGCEFVSADRRTVLADLDLTLASCDVPSRSVLYLQLPDET